MKKKLASQKIKFFNAVYHADLNQLRKLVSKNRNLIKAKNKTLQNGFLVSIANINHPEITNYLINEGSDINILDYANHSAAHYCVQYGNKKIYKKLLENKNYTNLNKRDIANFHHLDYVNNKEDKEFYKKLLNNRINNAIFNLNNLSTESLLSSSLKINYIENSTIKPNQEHPTSVSATLTNISLGATGLAAAGVAVYGAKKLYDKFKPASTTEIDDGIELLKISPSKLTQKEREKAKKLNEIEETLTQGTITFGEER